MKSLRQPPNQAGIPSQPTHAMDRLSLDQQRVQHALAVVPMAKPTGCVDVAGAADIDKPAPPRMRALRGEGNVAVRIVAAGHDDAWARKRIQRYRSEAFGLGRKAHPARIRNRYKKSACNADGSLRQPIGHHQASETVRSNQRAWLGTLRCTFQRAYPIGADGTFPVVLMHASIGIVLGFPIALPMRGAGIAYARYKQYAGWCGAMRLSRFVHAAIPMNAEVSGADRAANATVSPKTKQRFTPQGIKRCSV